MTELPSVTQLVVAIGGTGFFSAILAWITGHKVSQATVRKTNAEALRIENENRNERIRVENSRVEFETALNARATMVMENLERQINYLSKLVETQNQKMSEQSSMMEKMEVKILDLRQALDLKNRA